MRFDEVLIPRFCSIVCLHPYEVDSTVIFCYYVVVMRIFRAFIPLLRDHYTILIRLYFLLSGYIDW